MAHVVRDEHMTIFCTTSSVNDCKIESRDEQVTESLTCSPLAGISSKLCHIHFTLFIKKLAISSSISSLDVYVAKVDDSE